MSFEIQSQLRGFEAHDLVRRCFQFLSLYIRFSIASTFRLKFSAIEHHPTKIKHGWIAQTISFKNPQLNLQQFLHQFLWLHVICTHSIGPKYQPSISTTTPWLSHRGDGGAYATTLGYPHAATLSPTGCTTPIVLTSTADTDTATIDFMDSPSHS